MTLRLVMFSRQPGSDGEGSLLGEEPLYNVVQRFDEAEGRKYARVSVRPVEKEKGRGCDPAALLILVGDNRRVDSVSPPTQARRFVGRQDRQVHCAPSRRNPRPFSRSGGFARVRPLDVCGRMHRDRPEGSDRHRQAKAC